MLLFYLLLFAAMGFAVSRYLNRTTREPRFIGRVPTKRHAVVVGCGFGGMCAAKVLSHYFQKVTVIDRDDVDLTQPQPRSGVPQGQQLHGLLARGCTVIDKLFPGIIDECIQDGAAPLDYVKDFRLQMHGVMLSKEERMKEGPTLYGIQTSRPFLEYHLRRRLLADCKNVEISTNTRMLGLLYDSNTSTVTGVRIKKRAGKKKDQTTEPREDHNKSSELMADVVVCATGRKNQMPKWLTEIKVLNEGEAIPQEWAHPGLAYTTSIWRPPEGWIEKHPDFYECIFAAPSPAAHPPKGFGVVVIEKGTYAVLVAAYGKNYPPNTTEEIKEWIKPATEFRNNGILVDILNEWTQLRDWIPYHDTKNILHRYEQMHKVWPDNLFAIGDTVATFNPSFGQGMTQAAMHCDTLAGLLHEHFRDHPVHDLSGLSIKFQKAASIVSENFWMGVQSNDLQWPSTEGQRSRLKTFMGFFQKHVWLLAASQRDKMFRFLQVMHGLLPPEQVFFKPDFLIPVAVSMVKELWNDWNDKRMHAAKERELDKKLQ